MSLEELAGNENQSGYFFFFMLGIPKVQGIWRRISEGEGQDQIYISESSPVADWDGMGRTEGARPVQRLRRSSHLLALKYGSSGI